MKPYLNEIETQIRGYLESEDAQDRLYCDELELITGTIPALVARVRELEAALRDISAQAEPHGACFCDECGTLRGIQSSAAAALGEEEKVS